jgi:type IV secretion system protein VirB5
MKLRTLVLAAALACASTSTHAQWAVIDVANIAQSVKQVAAWADQYKQMTTQITAMQAQHKAMTGDRGMSTLLPAAPPALPPDWAQAMTNLTSLAKQIRQAQSVLTPEQAAYLTADTQAFLARAQDLSAANQAMAQTAYNDAAARESRLATLTAALAGTNDPKAAYDLANRIAIEHAALLQDQNQLIAATQGSAEQDRAQRLMKSQMRAAAFGTTVPKLDTSLP